MLKMSNDYEVINENWSDLSPPIDPEVLRPLVNDPMWSAPRNEQYPDSSRMEHCDEATNPLPDDRMTVTPDTKYDTYRGIMTPHENDDLIYLPPINFPITPTGPPVREKFRGEYNFQVEIKIKNSSKANFLYSNKAKRLFVKPDCSFPVDFVWSDPSLRLSPAYIRATVVFAARDESERQVETCIHHKSELDKKHKLNEIQKGNVLHSSRDYTSECVYYCGGKDAWFSTLVEHKDNSRSHAYKFICKNSCVGGINRRPILIIFTLEDLNGRVYGRDILDVRVCCSPRRDMKRDEDALIASNPPAKRESSQRPDPPAETRKTKKVKLEVVTDPVLSDDTIVELPPIRVRGTPTAVAGLEVMMHMMEQHQRMSSNADMKTEDAIMITSLRSIINNLKSKIQ